MSKKRIHSVEITEELLFGELAKFASHVDEEIDKKKKEAEIEEKVAWDATLKVFYTDMKTAEADGREQFSFLVDDLTEAQRNKLAAKINAIGTLTASWDAVSCRDSNTYMMMKVAVKRGNVVTN